MNKIKPEIKDDIAETLFNPLLSRAHESHRKDAILKDPMACELVEKIDYDFAKFGKITMSTTGTTIRLRHFDRLANTPQLSTRKRSWESKGSAVPFL